MKVIISYQFNIGVIHVEVVENFYDPVNILYEIFMMVIYEPNAETFM